jgi:hypothetical protein
MSLSRPQEYIDFYVSHYYVYNQCPKQLHTFNNFSVRAQYLITYAISHVISEAVFLTDIRVVLNQLLRCLTWAVTEKEDLPG